jgi:hypothetical protein
MTETKLRMGKPASTRQVNLMLTPAQEELVRQLVQRLREGGVEYETRVRDFVSDAPEPRYMHVDDLDRRFGAIERRFDAVERALKNLERKASKEPSEGE